MCKIAVILTLSAVKFEKHVVDVRNTHVSVVYNLKCQMATFHWLAFIHLFFNNFTVKSILFSLKYAWIIQKSIKNYCENILHSFFSLIRHISTLGFLRVSRICKKVIHTTQRSIMNFLEAENVVLPLDDIQLDCIVTTNKWNILCFRELSRYVRKFIFGR